VDEIEESRAVSLYREQTGADLATAMGALGKLAP